MSSSRPTQQIAFTLRIVSDGREENIRFPSIDRLARSLVLRLADQDVLFRHRVQHEIVTEVQGGGTLLRAFRLTTSKTYPNHWGPVDVVRISDCRTYEAFSRTGAALQIASILAIGTSLERHTPTPKRHRRFRHAYIGYGPVPGTRKCRGGHGFTRHIGTMPEHRMNALVVSDDLEAYPRPARRGKNLPTSWDDQMRHVDRCWKSQRKGRKSWDRE